MTLEQLRIFVAVAEREHVTRASAALNLTQSAVSAAIQTLEGRFQVKLFHRVGRNITLSEAGRVFLDEARAVLARAAAAERALVDLSGLKRGRLVIAASQTIAVHWLPRHLARFRAAWPEIALSITIGNTAQVAHAVREGEAELGFVEGQGEAPMLAARPVAEDRLVLIAPPGHPWALSGAEPSAAALAAENWVMREPGSGTRAVLEAALRARGMAPEALRVVLELPANEAVRVAVAAGAGVSALSEYVITEALAAGRVLRVPLALPARHFRVLWHRERHRGHAATALLDLIAAETPAAHGGRVGDGD
ncbi:MAG: LysR family transcriptional regulator [Acidibrevibacterium sp.]|jgi:DNA-binding transcriptional LysR family regulator|uniref:LysR substrate-binding domain-containing protein n=1 Tax=Acidibrevibacterium fodinaquatile TaxID=1969806 RepID=UPI000E0D6CDB|nr:LysR substrate-binding domain-containing protein [Acidibrevibacterium fodinaquatile]MCA7120027.1 LysR family transcriptional regulator [Acidibrevibacterium fodinaquatile]